MGLGLGLGSRYICSRVTWLGVRGKGLGVRVGVRVRVEVHPLARHLVRG